MLSDHSIWFIRLQLNTIADRGNPMLGIEGGGAIFGSIVFGSIASSKNVGRSAAECPTNEDAPPLAGLALEGLKKADEARPKEQSLRSFHRDCVPHPVRRCVWRREKSPMKFSRMH